MHITTAKISYDEEDEDEDELELKGRDPFEDGFTFRTVLVLVVRTCVLPSFLALLVTETVFFSPLDFDRDRERERECERVVDESEDEEEEEDLRDREPLLRPRKASTLSTMRIRIVFWSSDFSLNQSLG